MQSNVPAATRALLTKVVIDLENLQFLSSRESTEWLMSGAFKILELKNTAAKKCLYSKPHHKGLRNRSSFISGRAQWLLETGLKEAGKCSVQSAGIASIPAFCSF